MGYDSSTGIISAPVNTDDVASALGSSSHDVATLCSHTAINPWARYKPERIDTPAEINDEQRKNNNFGLVPSQTFDSLSALLTAVSNGSFTGGWTYNKIRPGTDWSRLTDFIGYKTGVGSPFGSIQAGSSTLGTGNEVRIAMTVPVADDRALNLKDFATYKNYYLGALLFQNTSRYFIGTCASSLAAAPDQWTVNLGSIATSYAGSYTAVPFLSSNKITAGSTSFPSGTIIVGTGYKGVTWVLKTSGDQYAVTITWNYPNPSVNTIRVKITLKNNSGSAKAFSSLAIQVATSGSGANAITAKTLADVTVAAGATKTWDETISLSVSGTASNTYKFARLSYYGTTDNTWWAVSPGLLPND